MHIENTHSHTQGTCGISAISTQLFCIPSRPVKNAISHGVVNMKNKHTRKSLPPVNYLSPDCIWPFTLLSVANYNRSLRTRCNLGIGMSNATSWIQIELRKKLWALFVYLLFLSSHGLGIVQYLGMCCQPVNSMAVSISGSRIHRMWPLHSVINKSINTIIVQKLF